MFGAEEFCDSVFYPAGGTDVQIILRTSHHTRRIISPTVSDYLTPHRALELFRTKCEYLNRNYGTAMLEVLSVEDVPLDFDPRDHPISPPSYITPGEYRGYLDAFLPHFRPDNRRHAPLQRFLFRRTVGSRSWTIEWFLLRTEGLATLLALHQRLGTIPRWIVTIQTGALERQGSLLIRALRRLRVLPEVWVRGQWSCVWDDGSALCGIAPYPRPSQDFGHYNSRLGAPPIPGEDCPCEPPLSNVKAFTVKRLPCPAPTVMQGRDRPDRLATVLHGRLEDHAAGYDVVFTSRRLAGRIALPPGKQVVCWDDLIPPGRDTTLAPLTLPEALSHIEHYRRRHPESGRICMTPTGYEDETGFIRDFIDAPGEPLELGIVFKNRLDSDGLLRPRA